MPPLNFTEKNPNLYREGDYYMTRAASIPITQTRYMSFQFSPCRWPFPFDQVDTISPANSGWRGREADTKFWSDEVYSRRGSQRRELFLEIWP